LLGAVSMAWHLAFYGIASVVKTKEMSDAYQFGALGDTLGNAFCIAFLSASSLVLPRLRCKSASSAAKREAEELSLRDEATCNCGKQIGKALSQSSQVSRPVDPGELCETCAWNEKVAELAQRRISAHQLLSFYLRLGRQGETPMMPHFDPRISTTNDVVRQAIIPQSRLDDKGKALAEVLPSHSEPPRRLSITAAVTSKSAPRMVTHHWANRFCDLVAAVLADGLGLTRWDTVAEQLILGQAEQLRERLADSGSLHWEYWICAICINQHASICGNSMGVRDTVTGETLPSCDCATPKYFNDHPVQCELNKFDCMMKHMHQRYSQRFLQVVAIDRDFNLFSRAWCVAELVEAHNSQLDQHVMLHSPSVLEQHSSQLASLRVENCSASRPEDKEAILSKIGPEEEIAKFNQRLQQLLLGSKGLLAGWLDGQQLLQEVGAIAARAKARSQSAKNSVADFQV